MHASIGAWVLLFLAAVIAYWPGLSGPFVLDDPASIGAIGRFGGVTDWETFKAFVFGGQSGPTGRPLALLTFLIDANNWPADPWPFKRSNLVIHLVNGALLGVLISKILHLLSLDRQNARRIALIATGCWLLHPFLVSTTLYVVQRMAELCTLFVFAGLITHLYGRSFIASNAVKAYAIMSLSLCVFTFLAMISKENGVLLPLLIGVVEATVIASQQPRLVALNRTWAAAFIIVPSTVIALYLGERALGETFFDVVPPRDFSLYERLLTQPRVLADYLRHWFIPELYTPGVFQDHFIKSTGLLSPVTTLFSALFHVALVSVALFKRRQWPLFALAILFFYASHLLESSVINLELYFEHRNYLAAALLFLPLVVLLQQKTSRQLFFVVSAGVLVLLGGFTRYSATVWEDFPGMVEASARKAPTSARAQAQYAVNLFNARRYDESLQVIDRAIRNIPGDNPLLLVNRLIILCNLGLLVPDELDPVARVISGRQYDPRWHKVYSGLSVAVAEGRCPAVSIDSLRPLFVDMLRVPRNADPQSRAYSHIKYFLGFIDVHTGNPSLAVAEFKEALGFRPDAAAAMNMATLLASKGYFEQALALSDVALLQLETNPGPSLAMQRENEHNIREFRRAMRAAMDDAGS